MRVTTLVVAVATTFAFVSAAPAPFPPGGPQDPGYHYHNYPDWKRGNPGEPGWKRDASEPEEKRDTEERGWPEPGWKRDAEVDSKRGWPEPGWKRGVTGQPGWKRGVTGQPGWKRDSGPAPEPEPQPTGASKGHASTNGIPGASPFWKREPQNPEAGHAAPAGIPGSSPGW